MRTTKLRDLIPAYKNFRLVRKPQSRDQKKAARAARAAKARALRKRCELKA